MTLTSDATKLTARSVLEIADRLACPWCAGKVRVTSESIQCLACPRAYPVQDGIALLARTGTPEAAPAPTQTFSRPAHLTSQAYQEQYQQVTDAKSYNESYRKLFSKRNSTRREHRILHELLASQGRCGTLLDIPAGGGRLSPALEEHTDVLIEADIAHGQVLYGALNSTLQKAPVRMTASAFHIPFQKDGVDGSVCCRLSHHLPTPAERERLVVELLRVSRRFAVMTFFDHDSLKNRLRRARQPFNHKPPKMTMSVAQVRALAAQNGAELVACPAVFALFSGHRFALMVKRRS